MWLGIWETCLGGKPTGGRPQSQAASLLVRSGSFLAQFLSRSASQKRLAPKVSAKRKLRHQKAVHRKEKGGVSLPVGR